MAPHRFRLVLDMDRQHTNRREQADTDSESC